MNNPLDNFGYYIANNKKYYSKVEAIMSLPKNSQDLRWWFYDEVFDSFSWEEPLESLDELYAERAQQLRDSYDHLVLCYSGGADSNNILEIFERNNIKLDEINFHGSFKTDKTREFLSKDPSFFNAEIYNIAEPRILELKKRWPNLIVNHYDWTNTILETYNHDVNYDWIYETGSRFSPNMIARSNIHGFNREVKMLHDSNKKVAYIWGVDKPRVRYENGSWYIFFLDILMTLSNNSKSKLKNLTNEVDELFYWSPHSIKILAKQAHTIKQYIEADTLKLQFIKNMNGGDLQIEDYYDLIKPAIYPTTFDPTIMQCHKPKPIYTERDWWFYEKDNRAFQIWEDGLKLISNAVGEKWLNKGSIEHGVVGSISKFYKFA